MFFKQVVNMLCSAFITRHVSGIRWGELKWGVYWGMTQDDRASRKRIVISNLLGWGPECNIYWRILVWFMHLSVRHTFFPQYVKSWIEIKGLLWPNEVKSHILEVCVNVNCSSHTPTYGYRACFLFVLPLMSGNPQDSLCTDSLSKIFRVGTWIEEKILSQETILLALIPPLVIEIKTNLPLWRFLLTQQGTFKCRLYPRTWGPTWDPYGSTY